MTVQDLIDELLEIEEKERKTLQVCTEGKKRIKCIVATVRRSQGHFCPEQRNWADPYLALVRNP